MKPEYIKKVELKYGFKDWDSVCAAVGHGGLKEGQVINKMQEEDRKIQKQKITDEQILQKQQKLNRRQQRIQREEKDEKSKGGIVVRGANDVAVRFSKCCNPVPGDEIVGFITRDEESRFTEQIVWIFWICQNLTGQDLLKLNGR